MDPADRILDANFNRAREALRVLEDYARLGLDDALLAKASKDLRHHLADIIAQVGALRLLAARDIIGDVGRTIATEREYDRAGLVDVVIAAGKRLGEALRVIEEIGKTRNRAMAAAVEQARYAAYELERQFAARIASAARFGRVKLYVLLTESLCAGDWWETADAALRGGADAIQLREKELADREFLARSRRLVRLGHDRGALVLINDRPDIAALADADGVHVGQDDLPVSAVRRVLPHGRIVGVSTHNIEQVCRAAAETPDYIAAGPMFASATKAIDVIPGPELLEQARAQTAVPLVAIGGIQPDNLSELRRRGCSRICVCQAVIGHEDPEAAARTIRGLLDVSLPCSPAASLSPA